MKMRKFDLLNVENLTFHITGKVKLNIYSTAGQSYIELVSGYENTDVRLDENNVYLENKNKISLSGHMPRTEKNRQDENRNPISILADIALDIVDLVGNTSLHKENTLEVNVFLKEYIDLSILGENADLILNKTKLNNVSVNVANVHFSGYDYYIDNFNLNVSNLSGSFLFDTENKKIKIHSNNARINVKTKQEFDGKLMILGNNLKKSGETEAFMRLSNPESGEFISELNNGKVELSQ